MWRSHGDLVSRTTLVAALTLLTLTLPACAGSPSAPETTSTLLGTWSGSLTGEGMGDGSIMLTFTRQTGVDPLFRVAGDWSVANADSRFNGAGTFSGGSVAAGAIALELATMVVACPGQPGGTAARSALATLTIDGRRMSGRFVVPDCPGGEMVLSRR